MIEPFLYIFITVASSLSILFQCDFCESHSGLILGNELQEVAQVLTKIDLAALTLLLINNVVDAEIIQISFEQKLKIVSYNIDSAKQLSCSADEFSSVFYLLGVGLG